MTSKMEMCMQENNQKPFAFEYEFSLGGAIVYRTWVLSYNPRWDGHT